MTNRPLPSPTELHRFAVRVRDELERAWMAGEPDAIPPVQLRPIEALEAERHLIEQDVAAQEAEWLRRDEERRRAEIAADPELQRQRDELLSTPNWHGDEPVAAAAATSLVPEGSAQRLPNQNDRFSQQRFPQLGRIADADGALALAPDHEQAPAEGPDAHAGHGCCRDATAPRGARTLLGRNLAAEEDGELGALVLELRCRSWRCSCCNPRLLRRNRARALRGVTAPAENRATRRHRLPRGRSTWFATITIDPSSPAYRAWLAGSWPRQAARASAGRPVTVHAGGTPGAIEAGGRILTGRQALARQSIPYAASAWNRLRLALDREFGGRLSYYRAIELHRSGMAHIHLLIRTGSSAEWFMHFRTFRRLLVRAGFGQVTDVQLINSPAKAARYVTKMTAGYVSKGSELMPRWTRRGTWSRDWCTWEKPTAIAGFTWELVNASAAFVADGLTSDGYRLLDPGHYRIRPAPQ